MKTCIIALALLSHAQAQVVLLPEGMKAEYAEVVKANPSPRLVGCVPETPQTIGMISAAQFSKMKKAPTSSMFPGERSWIRPPW